MRMMDADELRALTFSSNGGNGALDDLKNQLCSKGILDEKQFNDAISANLEGNNRTTQLPIVVVFDTSSSVEDFRPQMEDAFSKFVDSVLVSSEAQSRIDLCLVTFDKTVNIIRSFGNIREYDKKNFSLTNTEQGNETRLECAIAAAMLLHEGRRCKYIDKRRSRKRGIILLITDFGNNDNMEFEGTELYHSVKHWMDALLLHDMKNNKFPLIGFSHCVFPSVSELSQDEKNWMTYFGSRAFEGESFTEQLNKAFSDLKMSYGPDHTKQGPNSGSKYQNSYVKRNTLDMDRRNNTFVKGN